MRKNFFQQEKAILTRDRVLVFQKELAKGLLNQFLSSKLNLYRKSDVYEYYQVTDKTFKNWMTFFCSEKFNSNLVRTSNHFTDLEWVEINEKLGLCYGNLRQTKTKDQLITIIFGENDTSTRYSELKKFFIEEIENGEELYKEMDVFPPRIVALLLNKSTDLLCDEEIKEVNSYNKHLFVKISGNTTVLLGKTEITAAPKDNNSKVEIFSAAFDLPQKINTQPQRKAYLAKRKKIFNSALKTAKIDKRTSIGAVLVKYFNENRFDVLLKLTVTV